MLEFWRNIEENWVAYLWTAVGICLILTAAGILSRIAKRLIGASYTRRAQKLPLERRKKLDTVSGIMQSVSKYAIWFVALVAVVGQLGLTATMNSMLAAAGIGGLALGIGAQSFIKDLVAGLFIVFEDQASVGDYVEAAGVTGIIQEIALRTTVIRSLRGELYVIPNGSIGILTNYSRSNYLALVDVQVAYDADIQRAMACMREEAEAYAGEYADTVEPPELLGVTSLSEGGVTLRLVMRVKPLSHFVAERALMERIKLRLEREHIAMPYDRVAIIDDKDEKA